MTKKRDMSYLKRVEEVNRIYDRHARSGLSNREIWRRYIYPVFYISERTFYNMMNATTTLASAVVASDMPSLFDSMEHESETEHKNDL